MESVSQLPKLSRYYLNVICAFFLLSLSLAACGTNSSSSTTNNGPTTVNLGYFPNITHAVALVGVGRGTFQQALGKNQLSTKLFNAGPNLISALLGGSIDIGFTGPNPAITGYTSSHGQALRIIAGASSGGASLIVNPAAHITKPSDLNGKKIADPQAGGTQDISLRYYLQQHDLKPTDKGGQVQIIPTSNANILTEFKDGQLDGAWVPEPYASQLVVQDKGQVFVDERTLWPQGQFVTTNVIVRTAFLTQHPDIVKAFLGAEVETVQYINAHPADAQTIVNNQLKTLTGKTLSEQIITRAFSTLSITYDPLAASLFESANHAYDLGLLGTSKPDLSGIYDLGPLNSVLQSKKLAEVSAS